MSWAPKILFRTDSFPNPNRWNSDFVSLSPELVELAHSKKVKLLGIDTPSVDPEKDTVLLAHQAIYKADMAILEGIVLSDVPDGRYWLMALPLKMTRIDASPVRAILFKEPI